MPIVPEVVPVVGIRPVVGIVDVPRPHSSVALLLYLALLLQPFVAYQVSQLYFMTRYEP